MLAYGANEYEQNKRLKFAEDFEDINEIFALHH
jgi:hypothetical protein